MKEVSYSNLVEHKYGHEYRGGFGGAGHGDGEFIRPGGIAIGRNGDIYMVDTGDAKITRFSNSGQFITKWGSLGTGDGQFFEPINIAVDSKSNVYVTDNTRVQKFSNDGTFIKSWGSPGNADGQFRLPKGIAAESDDDILVVDSLNLRIQKFSSDGEFIRKWGERGFGDDQFERDISGIAVDIDDNNYVTQGNNPNFDNNYVQKFDPKGNFIRKFGHLGLGPEDLDGSPTGIAVHGDTVAVTTPRIFDSRFFNVSEFTREGLFIAKFGQTGLEVGRIQDARFIATESTNNDGLMHYVIGVGGSLPTVKKYEHILIVLQH
jgi:tripartite motif-containing protein 71